MSWPGLLIGALLLFSLSADAGNWMLPGFTTVSTPVSAPKIHLADLDGDTHSLSDLRGNAVVVNFWASWCLPCRAELPSMERAWQKLKNRHFKMLAISVGEDIQTIDRFLRGLPSKPSFQILIDPSSVSATSWPMRGLPISFVINKQGSVVYVIQGARDWDRPEVIALLERLSQEVVAEAQLNPP